ncbi:MAG TPA: DUF937 domain-containing protein [Vicinamibacteria bacterium]|nr:DUF937 domain-containing protein [Vicinamibacteria bacterium]
MSEIMDILGQALGGPVVGEMSRSIGAGRDQTAAAIGAALPLLLGALSKNASSGGGAASLYGALDRDHDGSVLDDVVGFFDGPSQGAGDAILGHVLGNRRPGVETGISKASGLDAAKVAQLLSLLAPLVMGALAKAQRQRGLDAGGLSSFLQDERRSTEKAAPDVMSSLGRLLDADADGSALDDVAQIGSGLLGALFKR